MESAESGIESDQKVLLNSQENKTGPRVIREVVEMEEGTGQGVCVRVCVCPGH